MADTFTSETYNTLCNDAEGYLLSGASEQARELLLKAISLIGTRPRARSLLADTCMSMELWPEAREQLEILITLEEGNIRNNFRLGQVLEEVGEYQLAADNYSVVISVSHDHHAANVAMKRIESRIQESGVNLADLFTSPAAEQDSGEVSASGEESSLNSHSDINEGGVQVLPDIPSDEVFAEADDDEESSIDKLLENIGMDGSTSKDDKSDDMSRLLENIGISNTPVSADLEALFASNTEPAVKDTDVEESSGEEVPAGLESIFAQTPASDETGSAKTPSLDEIFGSVSPSPDLLEETEKEPSENEESYVTAEDVLEEPPPLVVSETEEELAAETGEAAETDILDSTPATGGVLADVFGAAAPEPETLEEPEVETEPETPEEPEAETEPETLEEPEAETEPETLEEPEVETEPEPIEEPEAETEPETIEEPEAVGFPTETDSSVFGSMDTLEAIFNAAATVPFARLDEQTEEPPANEEESVQVEEFTEEPLVTEAPQVLEEPLVTEPPVSGEAEAPESVEEPAAEEEKAILEEPSDLVTGPETLEVVFGESTDEVEEKPASSDDTAPEEEPDAEESAAVDSVEEEPAEEAAESEIASEEMDEPLQIVQISADEAEPADYFVEPWSEETGMVSVTLFSGEVIVLSSVLAAFETSLLPQPREGGITLISGEGTMMLNCGPAEPLMLDSEQGMTVRQALLALVPDGLETEPLAEGPAVMEKLIAPSGKKLIFLTPVCAKKLVIESGTELQVREASIAAATPSVTFSTELSLEGYVMIGGQGRLYIME